MRSEANIETITRGHLRGTTLLEYVSLLACMGVVVGVSAFSFGGEVRDTLGFGARGMEVAAAGIKGGNGPGKVPGNGSGQPEEDEPEKRAPVVLVFSGTTAGFDARLDPTVYTSGEDLGTLEDIDALDKNFDDFRDRYTSTPVAQRDAVLKPDAAVGIDWGPGAQNCPSQLAPVALSASYSCTYDHEGIHTVRIDPAINRLSRFDPTLVRVESWGEAPLQSLMMGFHGTPSLEYVPPVLPPSVTNLAHAFYHHQNIPAEVSSWNVEGVRNFTCMFANALVDIPLNGWDTGSAENMSCMFMHADMNQPLDAWDTTSVKGMNNMFNHSTVKAPTD